MNPEDELLIGILAEPDDPAPRLVYADWLEEHGDRRAEWVRRSCEALEAPAGSPERQGLRLKLRAVLDRKGLTWPEVEGVVLTWDLLVSVFRYRLAETIAWCSDQRLPLRSRELDPGPEPTDLVQWGQRVQRVTRARGQALASLGRTPQHLAPDLAGGRLLAYLPQFESPRPRLWWWSRSHYLDRTLLPAWDTWLLFGREPPTNHSYQLAEGYLLAWVPQHLRGNVERAVSAHPEADLCWAEELDRPFLRRLEEAGLTGS